MDEISLRSRMLLGEKAMERLRGSHVAVFGLGGVGSWCAEALCRSGVGELTLVDRDRVSESNRNRQLCALGSTVGLPKAVVDCIDLVSCKLDLILSCRARGIPVISALGTGNKKDASLLRVDDISKTYGCALARVMRKELRARGVEHHPVVFSPEEPMTPEQLEAPDPGRRSVPGSLVWVPATAGLLLCQHVVLALAEGPEKTLD